MSKKCSICALPRDQRSYVETSLLKSVNGVRALPIAAVARESQVSRDALWRHVHNNHRLPAVPVLAGDAADLDLSSLTSRALDVADMVRRIRVSSEQDGHTVNALKAAEQETRTISVLLGRMGLTETSAVEALSDAKTLFRSVGEAAREDPALAEAIAVQLEKRDAYDMAAVLRHQATLTN